MQDRGHRVTLLTPADAAMFPVAKRMGVAVEAIDIRQKRLEPLWALRRWLALHAHEYDVINTHSSTDSWLAAVACKTLAAAPPMVRTRHVSTAINNHWSTRWLYQTATAHIVTTGEALRQQLSRDNGIAPERMTSVRTGIDLARFRPLDKTQTRHTLRVADTPTIGILATLRDWKGHDYLLDALKILRPTFPQWRLLVIGDGPQRARLSARTRDESLADIVRFVGNVDNVPEWLSALDLFALPSYGDEGVPQGIMQAMACGLPVVSTPVGAITEAVQDGTTGMLVAPKNAQALAQALATLMHDQTMRQQMGQAGHDYAQQAFGIDVMLDRMTDVCERVIAAHRTI